MTDTEQQKPKKCPTCLGIEKDRPLSMQSYCNEHNVCATCGIHRSKLTETPWGARYGAFICSPCEKEDRARRVSERKNKNIDHTSTYCVVCPHCGYEFSDCYEMKEGKHDCPECELEFDLEIEYSVTYSTSSGKTK